MYYSVAPFSLPLHGCPFPTHLISFSLSTRPCLWNKIFYIFPCQKLLSLSDLCARSWLLTGCLLS
jgi:hypothetical protein